MKKFIFLILTSLILQAQEKDPYQILDKVKAEYRKIKDYKCTAEIKIDVNFLKVPKAKTIIFYKYPEKFKMKSETFALLPKQGMSFTPAKILENEYDAIYAGEKSENNRKYSLIKVIPKNDTSDVVITTLTINEDRNRIEKIEAVTKKNGVVKMDFEYGNNLKFSLPDKAIFEFSIKNMELPASMTGDFKDEEEVNPRKKQEILKGTVTIHYTNYEVNIGLSDDFFNEEK